jgi:A/G-specific adenine glycosylase
LKSTTQEPSRPLISPGQRRRLQSGLLDWFAVAQRPLPWRGNYDPYAVWISEIMLQQTQVETMLPYYERWMARFPDVAAVAVASEQALLKAWEGLGYYARARNLQKAAREIMQHHGGMLPQCPAQLLALPGIGPYTAGAIASIAYNRDAAAVDGNIARVLSRLFALDAPVNSPPGQVLLWNLAKTLLPPGRARDFNQGLMELGALVCRVKSPGCGACPLLNSCTAGKNGEAEAYPRRSPRRSRRQVPGVMLLPARCGRLLMRRRPSGGLWGGLWEFPWVECAPGEKPAAAAGRLLEELHLPANSPLKPLGRISHGLTHMQLELHCMVAAIAESQAADQKGSAPAEPQTAEHQTAEPQRWVGSAARHRLALARLSHKAAALWENWKNDGRARHSTSGGGMGKKAKMG